MKVGVGITPKQKHRTSSELSSTRVNVVNRQVLEPAKNFRGESEPVHGLCDKPLNLIKLQKAVPRFEGGLLLR